MAYTTDEVNLAIDNFYTADPDNERIMMGWKGDPVYDMLYSDMDGSLMADDGYLFSFDVTYASRGRGTAGGSGPINVGSNNTTRTRGTDARGRTHWAFTVPEQQINTLSGPKQLGNFLERVFTVEALQIAQYECEQLFCNTGGGPDLAFAQYFTLFGGDAATSTYTALDGTARNGLINFQSTTAQIAAGITRHGISAATVNMFVTQFVDNSGGSWAAHNQVRAMRQLKIACERGAPKFDQKGRRVSYRGPTAAICTQAGYLYYLESLNEQLRYAKGEDNGSDTLNSTTSGVGGGVLIGQNLPLWFCPTIDDAMTAGTAYNGYNGVFMFLNKNTFKRRYVNQVAGGHEGQNRQHGRVWRFALMPEDVRSDSRTFKGTKEEQLVCMVPGGNGGFKNWDAP